MVKKFYYSLVSLKYTYFMFGIPFIIFALAFIDTRKDYPWIRPVMIVCTILLAIVLVLYYREKFMVRKVLKNIKDIHQYELGGVVDRSFILDDRMLVCHGTHVEEISTNGVTDIYVEEQRFGKYSIILIQNDNRYEMSALNESEAQRFAGFLIKRNPNMNCHDVKPIGEGTLKDLGA